MIMLLVVNLEKMMIECLCDILRGNNTSTSFLMYSFIQVSLFLGIRDSLEICTCIYLLYDVDIG